MKVVPVSVRGRKEVEVGREVVDQEKVEGVDSRVQKLTQKVETYNVRFDTTLKDKPVNN